jgi:hypothetical protein
MDLVLTECQTFIHDLMLQVLSRSLMLTDKMRSLSCRVQVAVSLGVELTLELTH